MLAAIPFPKAISRTTLVVWALLGCYLFLGLCYLSNYFITNTTIYMGLMMAPYILILKKGDYSFRFAVPFALMFLVVLIIPVKTMLFLAMLFVVLLLLESCIGKINFAFFYTLMLVSPIFNYLSNTIGFPIRIWLSKIAGVVLQHVLGKVEVIGNLILIRGNEFAVNPACAGLQMMATSFTITLFVIANYERKTGSPTKFWITSALLLATFLFNILGNLFRIILLVIFKIMPENPFHDIVGLLCLAVYVIIPVLYLCKRLWFSKQVSTTNISLSEISPSKLGINLLSLLLLLGAATRVNSTVDDSIIAQSSYQIKGFKKEVLKSGVIKFENEKTLLYLKPMKFYNAEHNPAICWTGSGYEFKQITTQQVAGMEIYTGVMTKGNDKIYSAWWFDSGKHKTIEQLDWRWKALKNGEDFFLVNVNAANKEELVQEVHSVISSLQLP